MLADARFDWGKSLYLGVDRRIESLETTLELLSLKLPDTLFFSHVDELEKRIHSAIAEGGKSIHLATSKSTDTLFSFTWVEKLVREVKVNTVFIDPAAPLLPVSNWNDLGQVSKAMSYCAAWAKALEITLILVFHTNKTKRDSDFLNIFNRFSGSHAILGYASTKALLITPSEATGSAESHYRLLVQGQHYPEQEISLTRDPGPGFELLDAEPRAPQGEFTVNDIVTASGCSKATAYRHVKKWVAEGSVLKLEAGIYRPVQPS